jgi:tetratricopeptide (TPR) repeat protein
MTFALARRVSSVLAAWLVLLTASVPGAAQSGDLAAWTAAVRAHTPGARDESVSGLAPWKLEELAALLPAIGVMDWSERTRLIERALILHADIAILNRDNSGYNLAAGASEAVLVDDGQAVGQMSGTVHWTFARRLVNEIPDRRERLRVAGPFYRATAAMLQQWGEYPELTAHLAAGRKVLGDDPVLLLYDGTMHQAYAGARMQRFFDDRRREFAKGPVTMRTLPPSAGGATRIPELPPSFPSVRDSRGKAEQSLRRALAADATLAEARIRLAHVLGDRGRHADALVELSRLPAGSLPRFLEYYAALVTARESRALRRFDAARAAFERAARAYPAAPVPWIGLSELAAANGDTETGASYLVREASAPDDEMREPWWWIDRFHEPSAMMQIDALRQAAVP